MAPCAACRQGQAGTQQRQRSAVLLPCRSLLPPLLLLRLLLWLAQLPLPQRAHLAVGQQRGLDQACKGVNLVLPWLAAVHICTGGETSDESEQGPVHAPVAPCISCTGGAVAIVAVPTDNKPWPHAPATKRARQRMPLPHISGSLPSELKMRIE